MRLLELGEEKLNEKFDLLNILKLVNIEKGNVIDIDKDEVHPDDEDNFDSERQPVNKDIHAHIKHFNS